MLTTHSYVFILGAGAGKPYGFPLGDELYQFMCNNLTAQFKDEYRKENAEDFSKELRQTCGVSIDKYLNINKGVKDIGVLSVAAAIHFFELNSIRNLPFNNFSLEGDWYTYLYKKMIQGLDTPEDLLRISENRVSFITFNYDRSLEHFLFSTLYGLLKNAMVSKEILASKLKEIPFIHVYGKIGYLPWETNFTYGGGTEDYGSCRKLPGEIATSTQKMINLIYDEIKESPEIEKAKKLISDAKRIIFLGFGYDETNLSILGLPSLLQNKYFLGTAFKSTGNERYQIKKRLRLSQAHPESNIIDCDCLMLLREHLI
jgi:hypothetical protein